MIVTPREQLTLKTITLIQKDQLAYLRSALVGAPVERRGQETNLRGWWCGEGLYVCAKHAGRIMGRGCHLPQPATPVWKNQPEPYGECTLCDPVVDLEACGQ